MTFAATRHASWALSPPPNAFVIAAVAPKRNTCIVGVFRVQEMSGGCKCSPLWGALPPLFFPPFPFFPCLEMVPKIQIRYLREPLPQIPYLDFRDHFEAGKERKRRKEERGRKKRNKKHLLWLWQYSRPG